MDPYIIMGLPRTATFEQIRARYKQLAKQHHPDKWSRIDSQSEEYRFHEEEFKKVTVAYHLLESGAGTRNGGFEHQTHKENWENVFKRMEDLLAKKNIWSHLSNLFKAAVEEVGKTHVTEHHFTVPLTLDEIQARKRKKIRLFLKDNPEPFYVTVPCDQYPEYETAIVRNGEVLQIVLHMKALPHLLYEVDEIIDGELDLFHTLHLSLFDYFNGKTVAWKHLDGRDVEITIPPLCGKPQGYLWEKLEGYGLMGKGSLFITLEWEMPTQMSWMKLGLLDQENFLGALDKLYKKTH